MTSSTPNFWLKGGDATWKNPADFWVKAADGTWKEVKAAWVKGSDKTWKQFWPSGGKIIVVISNNSVPFETGTGALSQETVTSGLSLGDGEHSFGQLVGINNIPTGTYTFDGSSGDIQYSYSSDIMFRDLSSMHTLPYDDDHAWAVTLPFAVSVGTYTGNIINITTNGGVIFGNYFGYIGSSNQERNGINGNTTWIPENLNLLNAPSIWGLWYDIDTYYGGNIYYGVKTDDNGKEFFQVSWVDVGYYATYDSSHFTSFDIYIYPGALNKVAFSNSYYYDFEGSFFQSSGPDTTWLSYPWGLFSFNNSPALSSFSISTDHAHTGSKSLKINWTTGDQAGAYLILGPINNFSYVPSSITFSAYVYVPSGSPDVYLTISSGQYYYLSGESASPFTFTSIKDTWTLLTLTVPFSDFYYYATSNGVIDDLQIQQDANNLSGGTVYIDTVTISVNQ